jgi:DNA-binding MarR family transcriptional regulator
MTVPADFDEVVHAPIRLRICAMLAAVESLDFAAVRDGLGVADSVLSKHIRVLNEAGYVSVHKAALLSRVRTSFSLTPHGRRAYTGHMAALRAIMETGSVASAERGANPARASTGLSSRTVHTRVRGSVKG